MMSDITGKMKKVEPETPSVVSAHSGLLKTTLETVNSATSAPDSAIRELQIKSNQLYRAANELQRSNRFKSMILDSINQGIIVIDEFSELVAWNDEFLKLYDLGKTTLHKGMCIQDFSELFGPNVNCGSSQAPLSYNNRLGSLGAGEYLDLLADGTAIEINVDTRGCGGLIVTYTDVTSHFAIEARLREQQKQLRQQVTQLQSLGQSLEEARNQAVKSDQQKSRFLAMISHDIRTPMSAIISSLELLSADEIQPGQESLLQVALASGRQMLFLLSDIIEVSRSDGWNFTIEKEDVVIGDLLLSIVAAWQPFATRKSVKLDLEISQTIPYSIETDPKRLRQVVDNLLSNAIKFTEAGTVMVFADLVEDSTGDVLRIRVKDTGRGVRDDVKHKLFTEFGRVENAHEPHVEGTGLGLSICKRIVESMSGSIGAESTVGTGSVFWIKFPFVQGALAIEPAEPSPQEKQTIVDERRSLRFLVADDNEFNRIIISELLDRLGCSSKLAVDGQEAFDFFQAEDFDAILIDNYMPVANGAEVTRWIRALKSDKKSIPIFGITASELKGEHAALLDAGMTEVYTKPLNKANLSLILQTCRRSGSN